MQLRLPAGRWSAIVGPNGAGKSTLLRVLAGLLPCDGQISLLGRPLAQWPRAARARQIAWLGQMEGAADDLLALDVVMLGRMPHQAWLAAPSPADLAAVCQAMRQTRVWALRQRRLGELSGGERQRVLLARALAVQSPVLLMDEPLAHLDPPHQADWLDIVRERVASGSAVISVLHEISMALLADDLLIVQEGRLLHHGPCNASATHRALEQAFGQRIAVRALDNQWVALPKIAAASASVA
ncbi:MAG: ABC transporter ATP-binding protein [Burkholderiaceae bacterium]|nr:ABC transporter ATP-binding protein [Burkholderiaceae bacterium]